MQNKYIVSTLKSGLLIINQNRAHQRILYETYLKHITLQESTSQQLLFPIQLEFSNQDFNLLEPLKTDLEHAGFVFSQFNKDSIKITASPVGVTEEALKPIFEQLISDIENDVPDANFSITDLLAKSLARSLATKNGVALNSMEQEHILNSLFACKDPSMSPNNTPVFVTQSLDDIDKKFK